MSEDDDEREARDATTKKHTRSESDGDGDGGGDGGGPTTSDDERADDDPRHISDQSPDHNAEARGAQVELSDEEKEEGIKSAAPDGGDIQELPDEPAAESERDEERRRQEDDTDSDQDG